MKLVSLVSRLSASDDLWTFECTRHVDSHFICDQFCHAFVFVFHRVHFATWRTGASLLVHRAVADRQPADRRNCATAVLGRPDRCTLNLLCSTANTSEYSRYASSRSPPWMKSNFLVRWVVTKQANKNFTNFIQGLNTCLPDIR